MPRGSLRRYSRVRNNPGQRDWYLVSSHGAVLTCIAASPGCTTDDLAKAMSLSRSTVFGIIGDLRRAGMLRVRKMGCHNRYTVNLKASFQQPGLPRQTLRPVLSELVALSPGLGR